METFNVKSWKVIGGVVLMIFLFNSFSYSATAQRKIPPLSQNMVDTGIASYYHDKFNGSVTSTGEVFSNKKLTAASNTLPLNTWVKVTNLKNENWTIVRINDRMNKRNKRLIDLSKAAAKKLKMISHGLIRVEVKVIPEKFYHFFGITPEDTLELLHNS